MNPTIVTFVGYLVAVALIGYFAYRATDSMSDYILGGRSLGPAVAALSVGASDMSGWLLLGLPGAIYLSGASELWIGIGLVVGAYCNWLLVAARLRNFSERADNALTIPEYLQNRLHDSSGTLRIISALMILVFFIFYVASGLVGGARLFEEVFQLHYQTALLVGAVVIVSYTFFGGFLAVSWTDFLQGMLMLVALILLPVVAIFDLGGAANTLTKIEQIHPEGLNLLHGVTTMSVISLTAWGLGYFGQPHILARFMAIESAQAVPAARRIAMSWMIVSLIGALAVGLVGASYFAEQPLANSETVLMSLANALLNPWVAGFIVAAIMSAIMSTIDSQLLVCSSALVEDIFKTLRRTPPTDNTLVLLSRLAVLTVAIIAIVIALDPSSSVLNLVSYAWAGFGAAFGPVILLSLYSRKLSAMGAIAGILVGGVTVIVWKKLSGGIFDLYEIVPGFVFSLIAAYLVSLLTPNHGAQKSFDKLNQASTHQ